MILINTHIYNITSGLPGRRPVTPRAAALVKKHPVAQFTKFVNVWFIKVASAGPSAMSPARCARCPCRQCSGPCAVSQPHDFLKIGNFATFSEFLHINGRHFPKLFPFKFTYWPISVKCFVEIGLHVVRNPEHSHTDGQTRQLYIYWHIPSKFHVQFWEPSSSHAHSCVHSRFAFLHLHFFVQPFWHLQETSFRECCPVRLVCLVAHLDPAPVGRGGHCRCRKQSLTPDMPAPLNGSLDMLLEGRTCWWYQLYVVLPSKHPLRCLSCHRAGRRTSR